MSNAAVVAILLGSMAVVALVETAIPLHARSRWHKAHLVPNLALTFITFATNAVFNSALVMALLWLQASGLGGLRMLGMLALPSFASAAIAVVVLDFSFYLAHVAMHQLPGFWRFHRVHHSDPAVDVTTTVRQHPGEGVIRYAFMAAFAIALGAGPGAFAVYRLWSALNGLLEHANIRVPVRLDTLLSAIVTTPNMHKIHHSRVATETDTNFGNIFSVFDRLLFTFTPSKRGVNIVYGLDGFDDARTQTTAGLLGLPFSREVAGAAPVAVENVT
jgi:sterol desaturase/sphingolipid hydroxylase (fatty acid hydroxylase superfamily)